MPDADEARETTRRVDPESPRIVLTSAPDRESATRIARSLVESSAAACVNLLPGVRSIYRWKGVVEEADEVLLVAKTTAGRIGELESALRALHPYEVPECVVLEPASVEAKYLAWLVGETAGSGPLREPGKG